MRPAAILCKTISVVFSHFPHPNIFVRVTYSYLKNTHPLQRLTWYLVSKLFSDLEF
jgi:hypothetical protein